MVIKIESCKDCFLVRSIKCRHPKGNNVELGEELTDPDLVHEDCPLKKEELILKLDPYYEDWREPEE
jgi:hypothetical protein